MTPDRWTLALDAGELDPVAGPVVVFGARSDSQFEGLGPMTCIQGFAPEVDRLRARGLEVLQEPEGLYHTALVQIVKSRAGTMNMLADALTHLAPGGLLLVDGPKDLGIEAVIKQMRGLFTLDGVYSKSHGKLGWLRRPEVLPEGVADWVSAPRECTEGYLTAPGGFSADGPDRGSEILVALIPQLQGRVADFGAGWGYIAGELLSEQEGIETLDLVEADHAMLDLAQINVDDPRARFHWADVTGFAPEAPYDVIVSNPPFHTGRRADPELGRAFIRAAARALAPSGRFFMVANRHLPYEESLKAEFGTGRLMGELEGYKIYEAAKPRPQKRVKRR